MNIISFKDLLDALKKALEALLSDKCSLLKLYFAIMMIIISFTKYVRITVKINHNLQKTLFKPLKA
jgi:hypothetical protein